MNRRVAIVVGVLVLTVGVAFGIRWFGVRTAEPLSTTRTDAAAHAAAHRVPGYVCPMHPQVTANAPGTCPICGMQLVATQPASANAPPQTVQLSAAMAQNLGVRKERVRYGVIVTEAYASGTIDRITPPHEYALNAHVAGRVHAVHVQPREWIGQGTLIAEIDVPGYVSAQRTYLAARAAPNPEEAAQWRERLVALGMSDATLSALNEGRAPVNFIQVLAPQAGRIRAVRTKAGAQIASGATIATVAAPVMAHVTLISNALGAYEIKAGNTARVQLLQQSDKSWPGRVESVSSRVAGIPYFSFGVSFAVPLESAENNMFVYAHIETARRARALLVPAEAVIRLEGENRVVRARSDGGLEPVRVAIGLANADWAEVLEGLAEGDEIVTSGQFLLDAEANLRAGLARLASPPMSTR